MSAVTATQPTWLPEVLEFATQHGLMEYLEPLREATHQLFPDLRCLRIFVETDDEVPDCRVLKFEVRAPFTTVDRSLQQQRAWFESFFEICPGPVRPLFCLLLLSVK